MIESTGSMGRSATYAEELFVAEIERLRKALSARLQEIELLREAFRQLRLGICLHATDTVWAGPAETAVDFITRHLADEWTEQSLSEPQSAEHK